MKIKVYKHIVMFLLPAALTGCSGKEDSLPGTGEAGLEIENCFSRSTGTDTGHVPVKDFGMVLLEAMAAGVPVIATDCGGAPEVIADRNALFNLGDSQGLARQLIAFCNLPASDRSMRIRNARERLSEAFSDTAAAKRFFSLSMVEKAMERDNG